MDRKFFWRGFVVGSVAFILVTVFVYNKYMVQPDISLSQMEVQDLDGQKVELTKYMGKPLVVNYWATWCVPCLKEFPHFEDVKNELGDEVNFIMISDESREKITKFKNANDYSFNYLQTDEELAEYGINTRPVTYFYDADGILVSKYASSLTAEKLKELIDGIK